MTCATPERCPECGTAPGDSILMRRPAPSGGFAFGLNGRGGGLIMKVLEVWAVQRGISKRAWCEGLDYAGRFLRGNWRDCALRHILCRRVDDGVAGGARAAGERGRIDTNNMGKGEWIVSVSSAQASTGTNSVQGLVDYLKARGMKWVAVRAGDGNTFLSQFTTDLVTRVHADGMKILGYQQIYDGQSNSDGVATSKSGEESVIDKIWRSSRTGLSSTPRHSGRTSRAITRPRRATGNISRIAIRPSCLRMRRSRIRRCIRNIRLKASANTRMW